MADVNMSAKLSSIDIVNRFVPNEMIQSQAIQNNQKTDSNDKTEQAKQKRQEIASAQPAGTLQKPSKEKLDDTISQLNNSLQNIQRNLEFSIDKDVGMIVISVKDKQTDEVIRQIPSKEVLELAKNLQAVNERLNQHYESRSQSYGEGVFLKTKV